MLNSKERRHVLAWYHYFAKFGRLPLQINVDGWEIQPGRKSKWKNLACRLNFGIFLAHSLYKNLTLAHAFVFGQGIPLHQMVVHMVLAWSSVIFGSWYYVQFIQHPETYAAFARKTLTAKLAEGNTSLLDEEDDDKGWIERLLGHSLQDLLGVGLPCLILPAVPIIDVCFVYDPTMKLLLYAMLPESWKAWPWFWALLIEESYFLFMFIAIAVPAWQVQVIAFELVNFKLEALFPAATKGWESQCTNEDAKVYKAIRCLQLYVCVTNVIYQNVIFAWKFFLLGMAIFSGYAAIAHFQDHPIFGIMYYAMLIDVSLVYNIIHGKAFKPPDLFKQVVNAELEKLGTGQERGLWRIVQKKALVRQFRSIPFMGFKVGQFHMLERTSTPAFLDFVVSNIVSMLVAFK